MPVPKLSGLHRGGGRSSTSLIAPSSWATSISLLVPAVTVIGRSVFGRSVRQGMPRYGRLLLNAAGIGEQSRASVDQAQEIEIAERSASSDAWCCLEHSAGRTPRAAAACAGGPGNDQRQRVGNRPSAPTIAAERFARRRHSRAGAASAPRSACGCEAERSARGSRGVCGAHRCSSGVDHDVADAVDARRPARLRARRFSSPSGDGVHSRSAERDR